MSIGAIIILIIAVRLILLLVEATSAPQSIDRKNWTVTRW